MFGNSFSFDLLGKTKYFLLWIFLANFMKNLLGKTKYCLLWDFLASRKTTFCIPGSFQQFSGWKDSSGDANAPRCRHRCVFLIFLRHFHFTSAIFRMKRREEKEEKMKRFVLRCKCTSVPSSLCASNTSSFLPPLTAFKIPKYIV